MKFDNKWTVHLVFDFDMGVDEVLNYLDSCLAFDILDSFVVEED